ncbi:MAG TPA: hypothetical protein VMD30_03560 [Tepidisphaeraceae bacterium]|nr:hypothetical protein [Tepidisphaeraceae bacterium]
MLSDSELARRQGGQIITRDKGLRGRWEFSELTTSDGHRIDASFGCVIRALPEQVEKKMLEETFLAQGSSVHIADAVGHFRPALEESARRWIAGLSAEAALTAESKEAWLKLLADAANKVAFSCGLAIQPPLEGDLDSPTVRLAHEEQLRQSQQSERMKRASDLFRQFQEIRASAAELSPGQVLQRIGAADQAEMLRSLLMASAKNADPQPLWAVAGPYLVKISGAALDGVEIPAPQLIELPAAVGPLRSVQGAITDGSTVLLVGGRSGVLWVDPKAPQAAIAYIDPDVNSLLGFNAAIINGNMIWATHGEAGLVGWNIGQPSAPARLIRPAAAPVQPFSPRNLFQLDDERFSFTSGNQLMAAANDGQIAPMPIESGEILAVSGDAASVITIHEDGTIRRRNRKTLEIRDETRRCGKISAAGSLPWLASRRLLLASDEGPVYCIGMDDELVTQYVSPYRGLRQVAASPLIAAGINPDRQRLILWPTWDGRKPAADIHIASLARHRVADIEFA